VGFALCKIQGRITRPFMLHVPEFPVRKGAVTDEMVREWMASKGQLALSLARVEGPGAPRSAESSSVSAPLPTNAVDKLASAFLRDVAAYAESGIAVRFKRLGISVRKGLQLLSLLVDAEMIQDHEELTHVGRIRRITLTDKGRHCLEKNKPVNEEANSDSP